MNLCIKLFKTTEASLEKTEAINTLLVTAQFLCVDSNQGDAHEKNGHKQTAMFGHKEFKHIEKCHESMYYIMEIKKKHRCETQK